MMLIEFLYIINDWVDIDSYVGNSEVILLRAAFVRRNGNQTTKGRQKLEKIRKIIWVQNEWVGW